MIVELLKVILLVVWVFILPSFLLTQISNKKNLKTFIINFTLVLIFLPVISYYFVLITNNFFTLYGIVAISTVFNLSISCIIAYKKQRISRIWLKKRDYVILGILLVILIFNFLTFSFPYKERYNCPDNWAYQNLKTDYIFGIENTAFREAFPEVEQSKIELTTNFTCLVNKDLNISYTGVEELNYYRFEQSKNNIILNYNSNEKMFMNDEPFFIGIHTSYFMGLFNFAGLRILFSFILMCSSAVLFYLVKGFTRSIWLSIFCIFLLNFNIIAQESNSINTNYLAFLVVSVIIYFLTKSYISPKDMILAGMLYGFLGSIRPISLIFVPGLIIYFYYSNIKRITLFAASSVIVIIPVLIINYILYNNIFQFPGFLYCSLFKHQFFGMTFYIRSLFNFPFYDHIIRTPGFPYPIFIYLPLILLKNFGLLIFAAIFFGLNELKGKKTKYFFLVTSLVFLAFLLINENWRPPKTTLLLLILPFLLILCMNGLKYLVKHLKDKKIVIAYLMLIVLVVLGVNITKGLDVTKDTRIKLIDSARFDENEGYIIIQKEKLTGINLLPALAFNKIDLNEFSEDLAKQQAFPPFLDKFTKCIKSGSVSPYYFFKNKNELYLIIPHIVDQRYEPGDINIIDLSNITEKGQLFKDISSPEHCYTFDLMINKKQGSTSFFVSNISQRDYTKTIGEKVEITNLNETFMLKIFENGNLMDEIYVS